MFHHSLAFHARDGEDGEFVRLNPCSTIFEVPDGGVGILGFVGGIVGLVEDECAKGVETRGGEVGESTIDAEPRGESDEVVVSRGEIVSACDIFGNEVVLCEVAGVVIVKIRDVEQALNDAVERIGIGSGQGGDVGRYALLVG